MKKVLIVEDDPMVASINKRYTEMIDGFKVVGCVTKEKEIFDILNKEKVNLIILDVYLPEKSGLEILKNLRNNKCFVDVIMVTAANTVEEVKTAFAYGVIDYLIKPFEFSRFKEALDKYLEKTDVLSKNRKVEQNGIDVICCKMKEDYNLPKGLQTTTLKTILDLLNSEKEKVWTIKEISTKVGISNVTIKKYMDYLENSKYVSSRQNYGNIGRPEYNYIVSSN
ncbi:response regulator [Mycoplasmatota bacterium]|nr:response regulator [Mycoplasmatota bacterium]